MRIYRRFLLQLLRNYFIGSAVAVLGVGGVIISSTLAIPAKEMLFIFELLGISLVIMAAAELTAFRRHIKPIRQLFDADRPSAQLIREAYIQAHRFPALSVKRIFGPHLLGLSLPAIFLSYTGIQQGLLSLPLYYIGLAAVGAVLVASMHALIEFFLTSQAIRPVLLHARELGWEHYNEDISLDGRVLVSIQRKFMLSAFLIGTFPLFLFSLATQIRLAAEAAYFMADYWKWAGIILLLGVGFSSLGAKLLSKNIQQPIGDLHQVMREVQSGDLQVKAADLYSDEFSPLVAGFNHMVQGLGQRERMNKQLLQSYFSTLAAALDARDAYTAGHSQRVAEYSLMIGEAVGLDRELLGLLNKTALLHDIGKIGVRDDVLLKDGKLTDAEFEQIKKHPVLGEAILKRVEPKEMMAPLLPGVRSHHERYDGRGYPDGLKGEEIPLFGRIIAVADAFDAMTSDRPYRSGMPVEKALFILQEGKGTQWDPHFAQVFIDFNRGRPPLTAQSAPLPAVGK